MAHFTLISSNKHSQFSNKSRAPLSSSTKAHSYSLSTQTTMPHASCNSGYHHVRSSKPHSPPHTSLQLHIHSLHSPSCRMRVDRINGIRFIFSGGALGENLKGEFSNAANESFFATVSQQHGQTEGNSKIDDKY